MRNNNDHYEEITSLKNRIISIYEYLLKHFCKGRVKFDVIIKTIERGIILPNGKHFYKDYFSCTHTEIKKEIRESLQEDLHPMLTVIKIRTQNDEEILFSTDIKDKNQRENIIYLDDVLEHTHPANRHLFYQKINELKMEDKIFRERKKMEKAKQTTKSQLLQGLSRN